MSDSRKKVSTLLQFFKRKGIDFLLGTSVPREGIQSFSFTSTGSADSIVLTSQVKNGVTLKNMHDTDYQVYTGCERDAVGIDESSKATTGFDILGAQAGDIVHVMVVGRIAGMN